MVKKNLLNQKKTTVSTADNRQFLVYCDGGARSNPGPAAVGFLVKNNQGKVIVRKGKYIGKATNNVAEYKAVEEALNWLVDNLSSISFPPAKVQFYLDSRLVVNQLNGKFRVKNSNLQLLVIKIKGLENQLQPAVFYSYIPRQKNKEADSLVNQALDKQVLKHSG